MELSKKTTILLTPEMHRRLTQLAERRGTSLGSLVREAVTETYGLHNVEDRLAAVRELVALDLPVGPVEQMISESVPSSAELMPDSSSPGGHGESGDNDDAGPTR